MTYAVRTEHISKAFSLNREPATMFRVLKETLLHPARRPKTFLVLQDINIEISQGEKVGLIGNNGSGKTTLLKVLAGLHRPDHGKVQLHGKVTLLAGLGIGLIDDLSVKENVFLYGAIYGLDRQTIREKFADIIEWAELQDFVKAELKTLSSGMRTRLAFSTTRHIKTDILLLDEALTAADKNFAEKCAEFFEQSRSNNTTFLVATHDLNFAQTFCTKTLWLHKGQQMAFGDTADVLALYTGAGEK